MAEKKKEDEKDKKKKKSKEEANPHNLKIRAEQLKKRKKALEDLLIEIDK